MIPFSVRLSNSSVDVHITQRISGLSFRSVAPGGYASATFTLENPIDVNSPMLAAFTRVYIYDGRNGNTIWEGRLAMPGRSSGDGGEVWSLTAVGPSAHTLDNTQVLIYIDWAMDNWIRDSLEAQFIAPSATAGASSHPFSNSIDALVCNWPGATPINSSPSSRVQVGYYGFIGSTMTIGALKFLYSTSGANANHSTEAVTGVSPNYLASAYTAVVTGTGSTVTVYVIDDFVAGRDIAGLRLRRTAGPATTTIGEAWTAFYSVRILGRRFLKGGTPVSGAAGMVTADYVRASQVVNDLLGRMLPQYDGLNAVVDSTDLVDIDQLAYLDGATANQVLEDLMALEPSKYWAAWESDPTTGKYRFEWRSWGTTARYEATVEDGFDSPAPTWELYNEALIRWKDARGRIKNTLVTMDVPELTAEGITHRVFKDLSDEVGSFGNATVVGNALLAEHNLRRSGGTLTVARPIRDIAGARWAMPWEIKPGELIRVRGVEASATTNIAETTRDGLTVFRIVSVEANGEGQATLELDMFTPTEARALANLAKKRTRRR